MKAMKRNVLCNAKERLFSSDKLYGVCRHSADALGGTLWAALPQQLRWEAPGPAAAFAAFYRAETAG